jgi:hypothetical protein
MKKSRLFLGCMAVVAVAIAAASCSMPDYQLSTNVTASVSSQYADISYVFTNTGTKDLTNVQVYVTVTPYLATGGQGSPVTGILLGPFSISVGSNVNSLKSVYLGPSPTYANGVADVSITSVGWDDNGNSSFFN